MNGNRVAPGRDPAPSAGDTAPVCTGEAVQPVSSQCATWYSNASPIDNTSAGSARHASLPGEDAAFNRFQVPDPTIRAENWSDSVPLPAAVALPYSTGANSSATATEAFGADVGAASTPDAVPTTIALAATPIPKPRPSRDHEE
ncbi:hypothetical protein [Blastococcus sp. TBT05-19]|uniref:hypothetical protein n=1 Tax=Blastococcus sp. TBT05-19 TaxID=2250581 RepID=UPI0013140D28|nr:hypothetical protein [Blastococcus sp. TBT05-19]